MARSARQGRRIAVVGATGNLGAEVVRVLEERDFPVRSLLPVASERSLGEVVELRGEEHPVETGEVSFSGLDLAFLCVPPETALDWVRRALRAEVPCVDLSGSLAGREDVPMLAAELLPPREHAMRPLVAGPPGPVLVWSPVLAPLLREAGLRRVVATCLDAVSGTGREGVRALEAEVVALFRQEDAPEPSVFAGPIAFDLIPELGGAEDPHGVAPDDAALSSALGRVLGTEVPTSVTRVRVPTFTGQAASLLVETERPIEAPEVQDLLRKAPGVEVWDADRVGPTTRDAAMRDSVLVGRVRRDPSSERALLLWLTADPVRLAASNAVRLAEARFDYH